MLRRFSSIPNKLSFGFSGAGFLGAYHVGVAACLHRQGLLPDSTLFVTGVSAGSMIAAASLAGVNPDPDGMEVVLQAARRTRELALVSQTKGALDFTVSLDVLTPGFSLIDQVEGPFRNAIVKALGGRIPEQSASVDASDQDSKMSNVYDIDPELFKQRFPDGSLRIGLSDRRILTTLPLSSPNKSYRYVDSFRDVDDIVATCMLSSYIPGATGPLHLRDKVPDFFSGFFGERNLNNETDSTNGNDTVHRAGARLRLMEKAGLVKHGESGLPVKMQQPERELDNDAEVEPLNSTDFWDGGIADVFPTFDDHTVIIAPVNGIFSPNPAICPIHISETEYDVAYATEGEAQASTTQTFDKLSPAFLQMLLRSYIPTTFRHCSKARLGLNSSNAKAALKMMFSSQDEELYQIFRDGYDDAK